MTEFVALRPKLYAYKMLGESKDKKCKEVKNCVMKKLDFKDYKHCLFANVSENMFWKQLMFQNRLHKVHTVEVNKVTLNINNGKQVIQNDDVRMLAHRHKDSAIQWE